VLFTSSSTVRNLVGIAGKPHDKTIIAVIGPHTEATARELGLRVDVRAAEASVPSLVTAVADFAAARGDEPRPSAMPRRRASR
jgi:uroporphyrinogen III methyltransferase/synthase